MATPRDPSTATATAAAPTETTRRHAPTGSIGQSTAPAESQGQDAVGSRTGRGRQAISWRRNLWAIWAAQMLAIVAFSLRVPYLPFFLGDLGVTTTGGQALWSGIVNAAGAGVMAISAPFWGAISDRRGRKPMLLRAQFAATFTIGLMAFATAAWHLLALRLVEGALAGTVTAATAIVAVTTPKERVGFSLGMIQTAVFSGAALGPLVGGLLAERIGYRQTFVVSSVMMLAAGLITVFLVQERFTPPKPRDDAARGGLRGTWQVLMTPVLLAMTATLLAVRLASSAVQPIIPLFVAELAGSLERAAALAGVTLGVLGLTSAVSSVYFGRLGDRRGHRPILVGCALAAGLCYLPMALAQHPWQLIALQALFGVAAGGMIPAANAIVANVTAPERRGVVYGLLAAAASLGGFIGPLAGAGLAAGLGFRATFVATALVLLALTAMLLRLGRRQSSPGTT